MADGVEQADRRVRPRQAACRLSRVDGPAAEVVRKRGAGRRCRLPPCRGLPGVGVDLIQGQIDAQCVDPDRARADQVQVDPAIAHGNTKPDAPIVLPDEQHPIEAGQVS